MSLLRTVLAPRLSPLHRLLEADTLSVRALAGVSALESSGARNRRRDPRIGLRQPVQVALAGTMNVRWTAILQDFSSLGLGLVSYKSVAAGETLIVEWRHGFMVGTVRHCRVAGSHYVIGIELDSLPVNRAIVSELRSSSAPPERGLSVSNSEQLYRI